MADNFAYTPGVGETGAADDIAGVKFPRVKLIHGVDGTNDGDVSTANGLPVQGTVTSNLSATDNAVLDAIQVGTDKIIAAPATEAKQDTGNTTLGTIHGHVDSVDTKMGEVQATPTSNTLLGRLKDLLTGIILAAGTNLIGKVGIDQATANANEVVVKTGSTTAVTSGTAANCKVEATIAAAQTIAVTNAGITTLAGAVAGTEMQADIVAALPAGTNAIGKLADNSGVDIGDVDITSIAAGTNLIGQVSLAPQTGNGTSIFRSIDLDETEEEVKATAGNVYGWFMHNATAATAFVKF
jgi:hypothetical protein